MIVHVVSNYMQENKTLSFDVFHMARYKTQRNRHTAIPELQPLNLFCFEFVVNNESERKTLLQCFFLEYSMTIKIQIKHPTNGVVLNKSQYQILKSSSSDYCSTVVLALL